MDLMQKLFGTQRAITMVVVSLMFAIAFPAYFSVMGGMVEVMDGGSSGASGNWQVNFTTTVSEISDSAMLSDGETNEWTYELDRSNLGDDEMIAFVNITVSCNDNDDPGLGFTDSVDAEMDVSGVEGGFEDDAGSGNCNGDAVDFSYAVTSDWSGAPYMVEDVSRNDILAMWDDGGNGTGEWLCSVTLEVNSNPLLGPLLADNDEEVTVTWAVTTYTVEITAMADE
jgi:hypothetical protein